jgi:protein-export membrane protein SecD
MQNKLIAPFAILLLITPLLACGLLPARSSYKWHLVLEVDPSVANRSAATLQTVDVVRSRLNQIGVVGSKVDVVGAPEQGRFRVDLPHVADPQRLKSFITTRGSLQLVHVISDPSPNPVQTYKTQNEAKSAIKDEQDRKVLSYVASPPETVDNLTRWVIVESNPIIEGRDIRSASAISLVQNNYQIQFTLKSEAAEKFGAWTAANINQYLGVVLNDEVKSIAWIKSQIFDTGQINGKFTKEVAEDLAQILMSGPLPAPVKIVEEGRN